MVDDPNRDIEKYENRVQQVRNADIPEEDKDALLEFGDAKFTQTKPSTAGRNLFSVLKVARLAEQNDFPPVVVWGQADANKFISQFSRGALDGIPDDGYSENYTRSIKQHLRNLFGHLGRDWHEEIHVGAAPDSSVTREDLITQDEIAHLFGAAEHPRDQAMLALPLATFQRNAALRALRLKDIHIPDEGQTGYIRLNADAGGHKRADGKRPLTWATTYVDNWVKVHPATDERGEPKDPEAPLLCVIGDSGNAERGSPLSKDHTYNKRLRTLAERAELSEERYDTQTGRKEATLSAHLLRHTGITRAGLSDEFSDQVIKRWAGWTEDSDRLRDYIHLTDKDVLEAAREVYDNGETTDTLAQRPDPGICPQCGHATEGWMNSCPNCTLLLSPEAGEKADTAGAVREDATEAAITAGSEGVDPEIVEAFDILREEADAEAIKALAAELQDSD